MSKHHQIDGFDAIAETQDLRFLSNAAAARQPVQQPKTQSAYAARSRYGVLGFIYYATCLLLSYFSTSFKHIVEILNRKDSIFHTYPKSDVYVYGS